MKNFLKSFVFAMNGLTVAFRHERNLKVQLAVAFATVIAGLYYSITPMEWIAVITMTALVLCLEMVNTAIENLVNLVTQEQHPLAGKIKDIAAGAVLLASFASVVVGIIIFWKYIL